MGKYQYSFESNEEYEQRLERESLEKKKALKKFSIIVIIILCIVLIGASITTVPEGRVGVKYRFGQMVGESMTPGIHIKVPFIESVRRVDVREQVFESELTAYTKDTQSVESISTKINYYINSSEVGTIVKSIGVGQVESKLISPKATAAIKDAVGKYKAEDLIAYRSELQTKIKDALSTDLAPYGITISAVNVQDITFVASFEAVVEAKVAAEQEALRTKNETIRKEEEAKQVVIAAEAEAAATLAKAEAEAKANKLLSDSITDRLVQYEQIQKWDGEYPQVMGNSVNPFVSLNKNSED